MTKLALRAGFRAMQRAGAGGNIAGTSDIWKNRNAWMKPTTKLETTMSPKEVAQGGRTLGELGGGGEGAADMVLHPRHGLAVRKTYDPMGLATQETIARKETMGRRAGRTPELAQYYGSQPTPKMPGTMHFSELVAGSGQHAEPAAGTPEHNAALERTFNATQAAAHRAGFAGGATDVRPTNMVWDKSKGMYRTVDAIPAKANEFLARDVHGNDAATGQLPAVSEGLPDVDRRRRMHMHPQATWGGDPRSQQNPVNPVAHAVNEQRLRREALGIHTMPAERQTKAQRQRAAEPGARALAPSAFAGSGINSMLGNMPSMAGSLASRLEPRPAAPAPLFQRGDIDQALQQFGQ